MLVVHVFDASKPEQFAPRPYIQGTSITSRQMPRAQREVTLSASLVPNRIEVPRQMLPIALFE